MNQYDVGEMVRSISSTEDGSIIDLIELNSNIRDMSMKMKSEALQSVEVRIMCVRKKQDQIHKKSTLEESLYAVSLNNNPQLEHIDIKGYYELYPSDPA